jgi:hypothetical protein
MRSSSGGGSPSGATDPSLTELLSRSIACHPRGVSLRRETVRLTRAFGALILAVAPIGTVQACSDGANTPNPLRPDATTKDDAANDAPDAADAADDLTFPPLDAACQVVTEILDAGPDVDQPCRYTLPCGLPADTAFVIQGCGFYRAQVEDGGDASLGCTIPATAGCQNDAYAPPANGSLTFECIDCLGGGGRRPDGLRQPVLRAPFGAGRYFARMAHDEAASVHAFERMHEELVRLGAPAHLTAAAARSAHDETRHARLMTHQARLRGAVVPRARVRRRPSRSLERIARENATEGCIRETYGALLMHWQATHASDPSLRRVFARIAADETRHAALSWEVAHWAEQRLDERARARVSSARRRALRALGESVRARTATDLDETIGQPKRAAAVALLEGMGALLALG